MLLYSYLNKASGQKNFQNHTAIDSDEVLVSYKGEKGSNCACLLWSILAVWLTFPAPLKHTAQKTMALQFALPFSTLKHSYLRVCPSGGTVEGSMLTLYQSSCDIHLFKLYL